MTRTITTGWRCWTPRLIVVAAALSNAVSGEPAIAKQEARQVELRVGSTADVTLAGTLHLPAGEGPFPAVVFTHGSEPGQRGWPAYVRWAEAIRSRGVAALIFDKRGAGDSTGTYVEAPDLRIPADDLISWVELLQSRADIRRDAIGVLGWSQGGWVGPLAASRSRAIAAVVAISGSGVSPLEQNIHDKTNQVEAAGATEAQTSRFRETIRLVWTYIVTGQGRDEAQAAWDAVKDEPWFKEGYNGPPMMDRERLLAHPRMTHYVAHSTYEPAPVLERVKVPVLAVWGESDSVVPVQRSLEAMTSAFARGGNRRFEFRIYPGADHGIRVAGADGSMRPADQVHEFVADWLRKTLNKEKQAS